MIIIKIFEMAVPLKYLSIFWRTFEMPLIKCRINLILTWSENCIISPATGAIKIKITDAKPYVFAITSLTGNKKNLIEE